MPQVGEQYETTTLNQFQRGWPAGTLLTIERVEYDMNGHATWWCSQKSDPNSGTHDGLWKFSNASSFSMMKLVARQPQTFVQQIVSVQPMITPTSVFDVDYKFGKPAGGECKCDSSQLMWVGHQAGCTWGRS